MSHLSIVPKPEIPPKFTWQPVFIEATTLGDAWFQSLYLVWNHGRRYLITKGSYEGSYRLEFDFVSGFIRHAHIRPLAPIMPEGISIPPPTSDEEIEKYFQDYIMDPNLAPNEEYRYSSWIAGKVSQEYDISPVEWVIKHFKESGYGTNHCYIQVGNPDSVFAYERPYHTEVERGTSPCLRGLDFKIVENSLFMHAYFRSWDLFSGFCTNLGGLTLLNEYVAFSLPNVQPGPIAFTSKGLHVYDFALEPLKALLRQD
jgi:thymidylate synthase